MSDIERDHRFDSDDERPVDDEALGEVREAGELGGTEEVHRDVEAPEADVIDQHLEVPLDDDDAD